VGSSANFSAPLVAMFVVGIVVIFAPQAHSENESGQQQNESRKGANTVHDFSSLNLQQLMNELDTAGDQVGMDFIGGFTDRLIDITYNDRDTSAEDRRKGIRYIEGLIPTFVEMLEPYPEALEAYKKAYEFQLGNVKYFGFGSLAWKISQPGVSNADVIRIVVEPTSGPLIPNFIEAMPPENWAAAKPDVLQQLILDRRRVGEVNAVLVLAGLVSGYDQVAWNVLTEDERIALLDVSRQYDSARDVLVKYDLLPEKPGAIPITPSLTAEFLKFGIIYDMGTAFEFLEDSDLKVKYEELDEKEIITIVLWSLRLKIWLDIVEDIYGATEKEKLAQEIMDVFEEAKDFDSFLEKFTVAEEYRDDDVFLGPDLSIGAVFSEWMLQKDASEEENVRVTQTVADLVNYTRVTTLQKIRFMLRYFERYPPGSSEVETEAQLKNMLEKYGAAYLLLGSRLPNVEEQLLYEDWIGFLDQ